MRLTLGTLIFGYLAGGLSWLAAAPTFVTVAVPGATITQIMGINANGDVTGVYSSPTLGNQGFVRTAGGTMTTFGPPANYVGIYPYAVNSSGVIAGYVTSDTGCTTNPPCAVAFVRATDGTFTFFTVNGENTTVFGINSRGDVIGQYNMDNPQSGFIRTSDGTITTLAVYPVGINDSGETTGWIGDGDLTTGFVRTAAGQVTAFVAKQEQWWATYGSAINDSGLVAGGTRNFICDESPFRRCSVFEAMGFVRQPNGLLTIFSALGDPQTFVVGMNSGGDIAGYFGTQLNGFIRDRFGAVTAFQVPNSYRALPIGISDSGVVAGWFVDPTQTYTYGFLRLP